MDVQLRVEDLPAMDGFKNPLPGIPNIDSPFFEKLFIDPEIKRIAMDLRNKGYAVIDFPEAQFAEIADRITASLKPRYDWDQWRREPTTFNARIQDAWRFDADVRRIATNEKVAELLEALYGRPAFPFQTLNFCVGSQQRVHSDSLHFSSYPAHFMCGVWVAMEDIDESNGPLIYYPGSNQWPIYTNEHIGINATTLATGTEAYAKYEDMWQDIVTARGTAPERFFARKGQAIIWSANLLHGGDTHIDVTRTRWSQVTHYYFKDCAYHTPMMSDPYTGRIFFREPIDIATGEVVKNQVSGVPTPPQFIRETMPPFVKPPFAKRAVRKIRRLIGHRRR